MIVLPLNEEARSGRRPPWVTLGLLLACVVVFVHHRTADREVDVRTEAAIEDAWIYFVAHPYVNVDDDLAEMFGEDQVAFEADVFRNDLRHSGSPGIPDFVRHHDQIDFDTKVDAVFQAMESHSFYRLGFFPDAMSSPDSSFLTYVLVHEDWIHLLSNLALVLLAGLFLEEAWGRGIYLVFVLTGAVAGAVGYATLDPDATEALGGASGVAAALAGAFLIRFATVPIRFQYFVIPPFGGKFTARGWVTLPLYGGAYLAADYLLTHGAPGIEPVSAEFSTWAHVGGFGWGIAFAIVMKLFRIEERIINPKIEEKLTTRSNPILDRAMAAREDGRIEEAVELLASEVARHPENQDAALAYWDATTVVGRADEAAGALVCVLREEVTSGQKELALQHWRELTQRAPGFELESAIEVRIGGLLIEAGEYDLASFSMRRVLEGSCGAVSGGTAHKLARLAQDLDTDMALAAAQTALATTDLDPAEREEVETLRQQLVGVSDREHETVAEEVGEETNGRSGPLFGQGYDFHQTESPAAATDAAPAQPGEVDLQDDEPRGEVALDGDAQPGEVALDGDTQRGEVDLDGDTQRGEVDLDGGAQPGEVDLEGDALNAEPFELEDLTGPPGVHSYDLESTGSADADEPAEVTAGDALDLSPGGSMGSGLETSDPSLGAAPPIEAVPALDEGSRSPQASEDQLDADALDLDAGEMDLGASTPELVSDHDVSTPELPSDHDASTPDLSSDHGVIAPDVASDLAPELDHSTPDLGSSDPDLGPEIDRSTPELDRSAPDLGGSGRDLGPVMPVIEYDPSPSGSPGSAPLDEPIVPDLEESTPDLAPGLDDDAPDLDASIPDLGLTAPPPLGLAADPIPLADESVVTPATAPLDDTGAPDFGKTLDMASLGAQTLPGLEGAPPLDLSSSSVFEPPRTLPEIEAPPPPRTLKKMEAIPLALSDESITLDVGERGKAQLGLERIDAISVAGVRGLRSKPVVVIDLVTNWLGAGGQPLKIVRLSSDRFDPCKLMPGEENGFQALKNWIADLLQKSEALALPNPSSAVGDPFQMFDSLEAYEREVLRVL
ncbi:MAG: rhomboid family intramembrane serine protease [Deltaproteobacteria bacterium]|nr:rhomboid family intramembrane serine protease [Deltaproteobacteria bacterium]